MLQHSFLNGKLLCSFLEEFEVMVYLVQLIYLSFVISAGAVETVCHKMDERHDHSDQLCTVKREKSETSSTSAKVGSTSEVRASEVSLFLLEYSVFVCRYHCPLY